MTNKEFREYITELYGTFSIGGVEFDAGDILYKLDCIAFQVAKNEHELERGEK